MKKEKNKYSDNYSFGVRAKKDWYRNWELYLLAIPVIAFYIIFAYKPMYGAYMAFTDFSPAKGILGSDFVGFKHFTNFFSSIYFWRLIKNTLIISLTSLAIGFPAPIILALMLNELKSKRFKKTVQTITYMPHFISLVVICGLITDFCSDRGIISAVVAMFTGEQTNLLMSPEYFVPVYVLSGVWQGVGWGSILYLSALSGIDQALYEAASIDGAGRWKQLIHVTMPGIMPTVTIMFILAIGGILGVGYEKIILLYSPGIYSTSDVISTFVYRRGLQEMNYSFSTAVGLFNSVINFAFLYTANAIVRKVSDNSLW